MLKFGPEDLLARKRRAKAVTSIPISPSLELHLPKKQDALEFFYLIEANRSYLSQWLPWLDSMKSPIQAERYIESRIVLAGEGKAYSFLLKNEEKIIGVIHLINVDLVQKKAMIGYWISEGHRGQGLIRQATAALLDFAFKELKLNRIEIRCATDNLASQAIPKTLGFEQEGILRASEWLNDQPVDHVVFSLLADEWRSPCRFAESP